MATQTSVTPNPRSGEKVLVRNLAGLSELADEDGTSRQRIYELSREPDFPPPLTRLKMGPVWDRDEVLRWLRARRDRTQPLARRAG